MDGYHGRPRATADALVDGWLKTGDLGFVHEGELYVIGRKKEVVIKGGKNIYPYDVERVASDVTGTSAAAFGRPNAETGTDDLLLIVELRGGDEEQHAELIKRVRGDLLATLGVKVDEVHVWPIGGLPRTTSGKVRRGACASLLATRQAQEAAS
jgi:acyl-CoA synthetase (AMP-forming)/AMP-acid ligase II